MQLCFQSFVHTSTGLGWFVRSEVFHVARPRCCEESSEVADLQFDFLTSGNAARHCVMPVETQPSEGFMDLNESDNKPQMPRVNKLFQVHVMSGGAKVQRFEQSRATHRVKKLIASK